MVFEALAGEIRLTADTRGARDAERAIDDVGSSASNLRRNIGMAGAAVSGLATGALAQATNASRSFEEILTDIEMVSTAETAREMGSAIREMAGEIPVAHEELGQIAETAARLGIEGTDNLRSFTRVTAEMAASTDLAADEAADSFARMSTLMEEPITNIRRVGDAVNLLGNTMATSAAEITNSATRSAGVLTQLGLTSQEILGLNAAMNEVSASSRIAGTQLRRFAQELTDPRKVSDLAAALGMTSDEFKSLRENNPNDLILRMAEAFGEGGEQAEAMRGVLGNTSRQTLASLSQNLDSVREAQARANQQFAEGGSLAKEFQTSMQTFNSSAQIFRNNVQNLAIEIGDVLLPRLSRLIDGVNDYLTSSDSLINRLSAQEKAFGLIATAIGAAGVALFAFAGGPITAAIAAVGALTAAFITDFGTIRTTTERVFGVVAEEIRATLQTLDAVTGGALTSMRAQFDALGGDVEGTVTRIVQSVGATLVPAIRTAGETVRGILVTLGAVWDAHGDRVTTAVRTAYVRSRDTIVAVLGTIEAVVRPALARVRGLWETHGDAVVVAARTRYQSARDAILAVIGTVEAAVRPALGRVETAWTAHGGRVETAARTGYQTAAGSIRTAVSQIRPTVAPILTGVETLWDQHGGAVEGAVRDAYNTISGHVSAALTLTRDTVARLTGEIEALWTQHGGAVTQAVTNAYQTVRDEPITVLTFLASTAIPGPLSTIVQAFRDSWAEVEATTRTVFEQIELTVATSMAAINTQIVTQASDSETAFGTALRQMLTETRETFTVIREVASGILSAILTVVRENVGGMAEVWRENLSGSNGILANARNAFTELWSGIIKPILDLIQAGWERWGDNILTFFRLTLDTIVTAATIGLDALLTAINVGLDIITGDWEGAWFNIRTFYQRTIERVAEWTRTTGMDLVRLAFENVIDAVRSVFTNFRDWLIGNSFIQDTIGAVATWIEIRGRFLVSSAFETVISAIRSLWEGFKDWIWNTFFPETFQNVKSWIESTGVDAVSEAFGAVVRAIESALNGIDLSGIRSALQGVISAASDAIDEVTSIPNNVTTTITQEIRTVESGDEQRNTRHSTSSGGGGGGGGSTSVSGSGFTSTTSTGFQHGGLTRGEGLAYLHPNEAVMGVSEGAEALVEKMGEILDGGLGGPQLIIREGAIQVDGSGDPEATADEVFRELEREIDRLLGR